MTFLQPWTDTDELSAEFLGLPIPGPERLAALRAAGVAQDTLLDPRLWVKEAPIGWFPQFRFDFDVAGQPAAIVAARDRDGLVTDLVA